MHTVEPEHDDPVQTQAVPAALQRGVSPLHEVAQHTPWPATSATPGTHVPLTHWPGVAVVQAAPFGFLSAQVPPFVAKSHHFPAPHWPSFTHAPHEVPLAQ